MLLRRACRFCDYPVASLSSAWAVSGVSPSAPGEQVLYHAVWGHAQGPEGPSPGVQRVAAGGRPRRSSLELSCGANHDRPLIVVVLSHSWGRARRNRTEHASHPMDRAEDLVEGLCKGPGTPAPGWTRQRRPGDFEPRGLAIRALRWLRGSCPSGIRSS